MACPSCGHKFGSDFKLGGIKHPEQRGTAKTIFEMPGTLMDRLIRFFHKST